MSTLSQRRTLDSDFILNDSSICPLLINYPFQETINSAITYTATGSGVALEYFQVHPDTGEVSVQKSLLTDAEETEKYEVRKHCINLIQLVGLASMVSKYSSQYHPNYKTMVSSLYVFYSKETDWAGYGHHHGAFMPLLNV